MVEHLRRLASADIDYADLAELLPAPTEDEANSGPVGSQGREVGYVYLAKSGRFHKIGQTGHIGRRSYELQLQLPERLAVVHTIRTDDPVGIERYWHRRFADRRANGEWFKLSAEDVASFRRWPDLA
jgi:hypothetical protein